MAKKQQKGVMVYADSSYLAKFVSKYNLPLLNALNFFQNEKGLYPDCENLAFEERFLVSYGITFLDTKVKINSEEESKVRYAWFKNKYSYVVSVINPSMIDEKITFLLKLKKPLILLTYKPIPKRIVKKLKKSKVTIVVVEKAMKTENGNLSINGYLGTKHLKEFIKFINKNPKGYYTFEACFKIKSEK